MAAMVEGAESAKIAEAAAATAEAVAAQDGDGSSRKRALATSIDDKLAEAERLKALGNSAFKAKEYKKVGPSIVVRVP